MADFVFEQLNPERLSDVTATIDQQTMAVAREIVDSVKRDGESAIRKFREQFEAVAVDERLIMGRDELNSIAEQVDSEVIELLERTRRRIERFAEAQKQATADCQLDIPGGTASHRWLPLKMAGCYAPGGRYPLPSSVLMTAVTARVAGVAKVWVASPCPDLTTIAAASVAGADGILAVGGAQAIAGFAYGIEGLLPPAEVIVGPGNRFVTAAKAIVSSHTRIDMLAGPSELVVVAGADADPVLVAADLLSQAEHDPDAKPILIGLADSIIDQVKTELNKQLEDLPTSKIAGQALASGGYLLADSVEQAMDYCEQIAPEHLSLQGQELQRSADEFTSGAAMFVGGMSAEVFGDYGAGPNHVLPTGGAARSQSPLSVLSFMRMQTRLEFQDRRDAQSIIDDAASLARLEGLEGHARSAEFRNTNC